MAGAPGAWVVVGASRGIGLEFVRQFLEQQKQVIAVVRDPSNANQLWQVTASQMRPGGCIIEQCDVRNTQQIEVCATVHTAKDPSKKRGYKNGQGVTYQHLHDKLVILIMGVLTIQAFATRIKRLIDGGTVIEGVILNSGILNYPNRATEISFPDFADHLHTNTIGPIVIAQKLLNIHTISSPSQNGKPLSLPSPPMKVIFISSDSGSMLQFRGFEDGFAAYAASKAALNMMIRHMAVELKRRGGIWEDVVVVALHPGEVSTDMGAIEVEWDVEGIISAKESVEGMLRVIATRLKEDSGGFWCWNGKVWKMLEPLISSGICTC